jgi:hypothetical protein
MTKENVDLADDPSNDSETRRREEQARTGTKKPKIEK